MDGSRSRFQLGPIRLPVDSEIISDGDEEIFLIYTELQGASRVLGDGEKHHGLGSLDSSKDVLEISFDLLLDSSERLSTLPVQHELGSKHAARGKSQKRRGGKLPRNALVADRVEIELLQDTTSLRSRKGDTGSVVWKASVCFAKHVLQQHRFPVPDSFFDYVALKECRCMELGSGTGILSVLLSPLVKQYIATDIPELVPLIQKNVWHNFPLLRPSSPSRLSSLSASESLLPFPGSNIEVRSLDWTSVHASSPSQKQRIFPADPNLDIILVVDCIYHPSLIPPLLSTIDHMAVSGKTCVLVISELRSEDVLAEFITLWAVMPGWEVWHAGGNFLRDKRYVLWVGWKPLSQTT